MRLAHYDPALSLAIPIQVEKLRQYVAVTSCPVLAYLCVRQAGLDRHFYSTKQHSLALGLLLPSFVYVNSLDDALWVLGAVVYTGNLLR